MKLDKFKISSFFILLVFVSFSKAAQRPLLLISLDGMRADKFDAFVEQNPTSNFKRIIENGLKADSLIPAFPSLTFPNHQTLVTG